MSAIAGMLRFDGQPIQRRDLERAANALRNHGPDRSGIAIDGGTVLVHALMRMTPEDRFDHQPCQGTNGAWISADLRLDNREDVINRISLSSQQAAAWSDSRVVLSAWEKLGDEIWPMLRGPFAAAIWDARLRTLTLARDHLGLNVVMWHRGKDFFAFATMPNALFAMDGVSRELDEAKFADFLVLNHADHRTTIYKNVFRVRPAHILHVSAQGEMSERCYWSARDIPRLRLGSDQDYADALRERLDHAVRRQMRSAHPIGCFLSGGLDSSAVAALAARALGERNQRLAAFTGVPRRGFQSAAPDGHYVDETPYVEEIVSRAGNIDINLVPHDTSESDLSDLRKFIMALEGPVRNPTNLGWVMAILRLARSQGRRVMLGGLRGNHTISWDGWSQSAEHLRRGRWLTALRQWRQHYRLTPDSKFGSARALFLSSLLPHRLHDAIDHLRRGGTPWHEHSPIRPDFAVRMNVEARAKRAGHDFRYRTRSAERLSGLLLADYAGDWHAAERAITGVEVRDPTADIDVVSFCLGIPPEQYLVEGIDRSLIRRAMWGLLPESVLTNRLSGLQNADWHERAGPQRDEFLQEVAMISKSPLAQRAIDLDRIQRALSDWPADGWHHPEIFNEYHLATMRGIAGGYFLRWFESSN